MKPFALLDDPLFEDHRDQDGQHPECPERLVAAREGFEDAARSPGALRIPTRFATRSELIRVHQTGYLQRLERALQAPAGRLDPDTYFSAGSHAAAWSAAGGAIDVSHAVWRREARTGFCLARPPGHHAEADRAMGFCLLNNIAIAAHALLASGAQRIAIVDWDVHHGNGTQNAFYDDPRVLFVSLHQWPFYPGTGAPHETGTGRGFGFNCNLALPAGSGIEAYASAFSRVVIPVLKAFAPETILVSAGFDAHTRDPLASMHLDAQSYGAMAGALLSVSERVVWILEGGYDLAALKESVRAVAKVALGERVEFTADRPSSTQAAAIDATLQALRPHWDPLR